MHACTGAKRTQRKTLRPPRLSTLQCTTAIGVRDSEHSKVGGADWGPGFVELTGIRDGHARRLVRSESRTRRICSVRVRYSNRSGSTYLQTIPSAPGARRVTIRRRGRALVPHPTPLGAVRSETQSPGLLETRSSSPSFRTPSLPPSHWNRCMISTSGRVHAASSKIVPSCHTKFRTKKLHCFNLPSHPEISKWMASKRDFWRVTR